MKYPKFRYWIDAMCCELAGLAESLVILLTLGLLRPYWEMSCICLFRKIDLKIRIKEEENKNESF